MTRLGGHRWLSIFSLAALALGLLVITITVAPGSASAATAGWWQGDRPITQAFGCTSFSAEPIESWRGCSPSASHFHDGVDIGFGSSCGTPLYTPVPVTVISVGGSETGFGSYYPRLRLPDGHDVLLGHVQPPVVVKAGQQVPAGSVVAYVGTQGNSTGCHLHFEVRPTNGAFGTSIDPIPYLSPSPAGSAAYLPVPGTGDLARYNGGEHVTLTWGAPSSYRFESSLGQVYKTGAVAGTHPLYECVAGGVDNFTSPASNCEGQKMVGLLGWTYDSAQSNPATVPVVRCTTTVGGEHFDSNDPGCEGQHTEAVIGYAIAR
jgi:Peptidase family M23